MYSAVTDRRTGTAGRGRSSCSCGCVAECAGLAKADAGKAVEALVATITDALKRGDEVRIAGFGSFAISERAERQGRNPQTGAQITIAASRAARFTAGKAVKDALNGG